MSKFQKVGERLYRYSNGTYYARFQMRRKDVWRSLKTKDPKTAKRLLNDEQDKFDRLNTEAAKMSLAALCKDYLAAIRHLKPSTRTQKERVVRRILKRWPGGASMRVSEITDEPDRFLGKFDFSESARGYHITALRELFDLALRKRCITSSPIGHIKYKRRPDPLRLTPSFEEFQAIVADVRAQPFNDDAQDSGDFIEFIGLAGLGQAEAANLRRQDVNLKTGLMSVRRSKTSTAFAVPIYPQLRPLMERLCRGLNPRDRIFQIKDAKKAIAGACRRLELARYSHRSLRRMFITRAIERGVDVKVIADWQGHRDGGKLILDTYSHVRPIHSQRMAQLMTTEEPENVVQMPATSGQNG